jgi:hypothetical protein
VAGKIPRTGGGPPGASLPGGAPVTKNDDGRPVAETRPPFAEKLKSARAPTSTTGREAPAAAGSVPAERPAELQAGQVRARGAVARMIDRVVDNQLGTGAPAAVRDKLRTALADAVAEDPLLASKIGRLS